EKGIPTPLVHAMLCPPASRMDILNEQEISAIVTASSLIKKYNQNINRESAYEILSQKLEEAGEAAHQKTISKNNNKDDKSVLETIADNTIVRSMLRTAGNQIVRSLLGSLGLGGRSRKKSSWF